MNNIKMRYYDRIDVSQPHVCNGYLDLLIMSMSFSNIAILNIKSVYT